MPAVKLSPLFNSQTVNSAGAPASGWKIYTYAAGSSTPLATYTDSTGTVAQTNPIVVNSLGFPTNGQIWLQSGLAYKLVLTDASDVVQKTEDNVSGINDTSSNVSQWQASGVTPTYVSANSFTLPGDQTTEFHVGRRLQLTTTAGIVYGTIIASVFTSLTTVTVSMDSPTVLDSGLTTVNLSILRADNLSIPVSPKLPRGFRNKLINSKGTINQEVYASGTATTAPNQYTLDMIKVVVSGQSLAFAAAGDHLILTAPAGGIDWPIEGRDMEGGAYYLNWIGTATATVNGTAIAKGGGIVLPANTLATVRFIGGTVEQPQFELNGVSAYESIPDTIELLRCQRYLFKTMGPTVQPKNQPVGGNSGALVCPLTVSNGFYAAEVSFPVVMRVPPTITYYAPQSVGNNVWTNGGNTLGSTPNPSAANERKLTVFMNSGASFTPAGVDVFYIHLKADARM